MTGLASEGCTPPASDDSAQDLLTRLARAREQLAGYERRFEQYDGNNPDKYQTDLAYWRGQVAMLDDEAKRAGIVEASDSELIGYELDKLHPQAQSRQVVEHQGALYQKRFTPAQASRSGRTVKLWLTHWERLPDDHRDARKFREGAVDAQALELGRQLQGVWPFKAPAGGLELLIRIGEPALLAAIAGKTAVSYNGKGQPNLRVRLRLSVAMTQGAFERAKRLAARDDARLWLGVDPEGRQAYLVKRGRSSADFSIQTEAA